MLLFQLVELALDELAVELRVLVRLVDGQGLVVGGYSLLPGRDGLLRIRVARLFADAVLRIAEIVERFLLECIVLAAERPGEGASGVLESARPIRGRSEVEIESRVVGRPGELPVLLGGAFVALRFVELPGGVGGGGPCVRPEAEGGEAEEGHQSASPPIGTMPLALADEGLEKKEDEG